MKSWFAALLMCASLPLIGNPVRIASAAEFLAELRQGTPVRVVLEYGRMEITEEGETTPGPDVVGGMPVETFEYFPAMLMGNPQGFISFSGSSLIRNPLGSGYIQDYVKVQVYDDGAVKVSVAYLDAKSLKEKMVEEFRGKLNDGGNGGGLTLYADK